MHEEIIKNKHWENYNPEVTVITPVYNRRGTIHRTICSLENQTYHNFEYIIINDGSTEDIDDIVEEFMEYTELPVMYIKKQNGGVHTARNRGIREARGKFLTGLDSDDEFVPDALERLVTTWESIPDSTKSKYREIVAQCMDSEGNRLGNPFPDNINKLPYEEALRICDAMKVDNMGFDVTNILKENLWPEPEGITFVGEDILWKKLEEKYCSYFINDMLKVVHFDMENSLSRTTVRSLQYCKNVQWNCCYMLNHWSVYKGIRYRWLPIILKYCVFGHILHFNGLKDTERLDKISDRIMRKVCWLPSYIIAKVYVKRKMERNTGREGVKNK